MLKNDMKTCVNCENPRAKTGSYCNACVAERSRAYYKKNREKILARVAQHYLDNKEVIAIRHKKKYELNKDKILARQARYRETDRYKELSEKWKTENRESILAKKKEYRQNNKDKIKKYQDEWKKKNAEHVEAYDRRRRARKRNARVDVYKTQDVLDLYGTDCYLCNAAIDFSAPRRVGLQGWENGLHIDHVIPISKGGSDSLDNVRPAHALCNLSKHDSIIDNISSAQSQAVNKR